jgi:hypothetical protein
MRTKGLVLLLFIFLWGKSSTAQQIETGDIRGFVYSSQNGDRISGAQIYVVEEKRRIQSESDGYYAATRLKPRNYYIVVFKPGFDTFVSEVTVNPNTNTKKDIYLNPIISMQEIEISVKSQRKDANVAVQSFDAKILAKLPSVGAEPDLVQYLQVLPGVVFSGDQGGQLYIRGGSPVMNKVTLDGMTIYNPFHSIGLFSVFDPDLMQSTDVYTAGFGAEYGGRISAIVDVKTRDGDRNQWRTKVGLNTFTSKVILEGPLKKFEPGKNNSSVAFSFRNSFLKESSRLFYAYANPDRLPYNFADFFFKFSSNSANGGYGRLYGFHFSDLVDFPNTTSYGWKSYGVGGKFLVVPEQAKTRVDGYFLYSNYRIEQLEKDLQPRSSDIGGFNLGMNFNYNFKQDAFKWGLEINGFNTNFELFNSNNRRITQLESTTELNGFANYRFSRQNFVADFGYRVQYYASLSNTSLEPRVQLRYTPFKGWGLKMALGQYSQNLLSAISDRDVVNLFYGFLSGPDNLPGSFNGNPVLHKLQKADHAVIGTDYRIAKNLTVNLEGFIKIFRQITNINRDKLFEDDRFNQDKPERSRQDFVIETGDAYGGDISLKYQDKHWYLWSVYSLTYVNRFDGIQTYQPIFDRRHNANFVLSYTFNEKNPMDLSIRWNLGSGFPFTQTQGYYEKYDFKEGVSTDYTSQNGQLGILYAPINQGRLPYYHRLDLSMTKTWNLKNKRDFKFIFSVVNVYDRANIFYFDRVRNERVNQLPFMPSMGCTYSF